MKVRLFSILLMMAFAVSFTTQAADIGVSAPSYQVDVTHSAAAVDGPVAMAEAKTTQSDETILNNTPVQSLLKSTIFIAKDNRWLNSHQLNANGVIGVSGGSSIGIRPG